MPFDREKRGLFQRKMEKPQVKKHTPLKSEGTTGSLSIRNVAGGVFLFFKGIGEWFKLFNSRNHMIPDVHGVYDIGSPDRRWRSIFVTDKSLHIGNTKSDSVVLGVTGTGEDTKLTIKAKESTGDGIELGSDSISPRVIQSTAALRIEAATNIAIRADYNGNSDINASQVRFQYTLDGGVSYRNSLIIEKKGHIVPGTTKQVNLGSRRKKFNTVYAKDVKVDKGTIYLGDIKLSQEGAGTSSKLRIEKATTEGGATFSITNSTLEANIIQNPSTTGGDASAIIIAADTNIALRPDANGNDGDNTGNNIYIQQENGSGGYATKLTIRDDGTVNWAAASNFQVGADTTFQLTGNGIEMAGAHYIQTRNIQADADQSMLIKADGSIAIRIDADTGETDNTFKIQANNVNDLITVTEAGVLTTIGNIVWTSGGSLSFDDGGGADIGLTLGAGGKVTKIGDDAASDGQVLTWDNSNTKVVWSDAAIISGNDGLLIDHDVTFTADNAAQLKITGTTVGRNNVTKTENTAYGAFFYPAFTTGADTDRFNSLHLAIPNITIGGGHTLDEASTLYILGAPTEAVDNYALQIAGGASLINGALEVDDQLTVDRNTSGDSAEDATGLHVDFDRTVAGSGTAAHNDIGINLDVNSASLGTSTVMGMDIDVVGATSGTHTATGIDMIVSGADTNIGMSLRTVGTHLKLLYDASNYAQLEVSSSGDLEIETVGAGTTDSDITLNADGDIRLDADGGDVFLQDNGGLNVAVKFDLANKAQTIYYDSSNHFSTTVAANGATTLATTDSDGAIGIFTIDADGDIALDSATGRFLAKNNGTEFSPQNSAYAGMILGYTDIGYDEAEDSYNLTTAYVVPTAEFKVAFVVPPSEKVLIEVQIQHDIGSSGVGDLYAGLSDNATYNQLQDYHEIKINDGGGRGKIDTVNISWTLQAADLPDAGVSEEIFVGFKAISQTGTPHLQWGGNAADKSPNFIMKATALPAAIYTGE